MTSSGHGGEHQILGQFRDAQGRAQAAETIGPHADRVVALAEALGGEAMALDQLTSGALPPAAETTRLEVLRELFGLELAAHTPEAGRGTA